MSAARAPSSRRALLRALAAAPAVVLAPGAEGRDYASALEVLAEIDRLEADVDGRLEGMRRRRADAGPFAASVAADHDRHRRSRAALRTRLGLGPVASAPTAPRSGTLDELRGAIQDLVHAHAEGLPALPDRAAVDALARDMVDDARHLAVVQMWLEAEEERG